jgi:endogenous inhibitor of DNA gyrase (YacG/DUF329 family)
MNQEIVKCPHCGYEYQIDIEMVAKDGETMFVKGLYGTSKSQLDKEMYIDQKCPKCDKWFEWKAKRGMSLP